jgi:hypothetical protein
MRRSSRRSLEDQENPGPHAVVAARRRRRPVDEAPNNLLCSILPEKGLQDVGDRKARRTLE